ncbi:MAG: hypothetical protein HY905_14700 [Deltaproteobacteria bacterium]|nr:hypothetical protein [Deltaproteobacteria bacterium]
MRKRFGNGRAVRAAGLVLLLLAAGVPACTEPPRTLRVVVDSNMEVPGELDQIVVTATASRTAEGNICEPITRLFELPSAGSLPLRISIEIGSEYSQWGAVRVVGRSHGTDLFLRELRVPWPAEGIRDLEVRLDRDCYGRTCGTNEQCVEGSCASVPFAGLFDDASYRDVGISCDRATAGGD